MNKVLHLVPFAFAPYIFLFGVCLWVTANCLDMAWKLKFMSLPLTDCLQQILESWSAVSK